jgi:hypothetical protein
MKQRGFASNIFHVLTVTNMAKARNFKVISDKFNVVGICRLLVEVTHRNGPRDY